MLLLLFQDNVFLYVRQVHFGWMPIQWAKLGGFRVVVDEALKDHRTPQLWSTATNTIRHWVNSLMHEFCTNNTLPKHWGP